MTVLNVLSFLPQGHTGAAETFPSTAGPALRRSHKAALGRGCRTSLICNFKKQNKKNCQLLLDSGMILKWDNLLMKSINP